MSTSGLIAERTTLSTPCVNGSCEANDHSILFDSLDRLIFPLRMWLVAPTKTRIHLTMLADGGTANRTRNE
jgi:hypothetical protein